MVFHELIGFRSKTRADRQRGRVKGASLPSRPMVRYTLAPHAPYSVSPALFRAIRARFEQIRSRGRACTSVSRGGDEFLRDGSGPCRALLERWGMGSVWAAPRCDPVEYLDRWVCSTGARWSCTACSSARRKSKRLAATGVTLVTCPRGNILTGAGAPPIADFYESGVRVAVGTDSLASVPDLNLFAELAEMRRLAPGVPARALLESATISGARRSDSTPISARWKRASAIA